MPRVRVRRRDGADSVYLGQGAHRGAQDLGRHTPRAVLSLGRRGRGRHGRRRAARGARGVVAAGALP
jgi:hypothetical protein